MPMFFSIIIYMMMKKLMFQIGQLYGDKERPKAVKHCNTCFG